MLYIYRTENCIFFLRCFLRRVLFARVRVFKQFIYHSRAIHWDQTVKTRELEFQDLPRSSYELWERRSGCSPMPVPINSWFLPRS